MTNHTDTSRIADLRFQVSEKMPINHSDLSCLFDRIEALEAENERLREALIGIRAEIEDMENPFNGGGAPEMAHGFEVAVEEANIIVTAALGERQ